MEEHIVQSVLMIIALLSVAVFSSMLLKKVNFPYTIGLVVMGGLLGVMSYHYESLYVFESPELSPGVILYLILPTLIFEAAMNVDFGVLKRNIVPILLLSVFGMLASAFIVAAGVSMFTPLTFVGALVFGALISATDPVAVIALFNEIGAPKRLVTLIDGESIFNDATAIVLFNLVLAAAISPAADINYFSAAVSFFVVLIGGLLVGAVIGGIGSFIIKFGKDNLLLQITVSLIMAYASFIVADHFLHLSGVMSTLSAGLVMKAGSEKTIKRSNIATMEHFWEYFSFVANSIVFLLLGLTQAHVFRVSTDISYLLKVTLLMIPVVIIGRVACVYFFIPVYNKVYKNNEDKKIPKKFQTILFWGGLRGAVPVALVLAVPTDFPHRELIIQFTFAFILFTLLFQGTTIKLLMDKLDIRPEDNEFGDRKIEREVFDFKTEPLAHLIIQALKEMFDDEAYVIKDKSTSDCVAYLMTRGNVMLDVSQNKSELILIAEPENVSYFKRVLYETLLDLDKAVLAIKEITNPDKMNDLIIDNDDGNNDGKLSFNIMRCLSSEQMVMNVRAKDKIEILRELTDDLVKCGAIEQKDYEGVLSELIEREETMTTALGDNVAMPHARKSPFVSKVTILIALAPDGVDFGALDGKPVNVFVLIISPKAAEDPHVQVLAAMSKILSNKNNRDILLASKNPADLYSRIHDIAKGIK